MKRNRRGILAAPAIAGAARCGGGRCIRAFALLHLSIRTCGRGRRRCGSVVIGITTGLMSTTALGASLSLTEPPFGLRQGDAGEGQNGDHAK